MSGSSWGDTVFLEASPGLHLLRRRWADRGVSSMLGRAWLSTALQTGALDHSDSFHLLLSCGESSSYRSHVWEPAGRLERRQPTWRLVAPAPCRRYFPSLCKKGAGKFIQKLWLKECLRSGNQMRFVTFTCCILWYVSTYCAITAAFSEVSQSKQGEYTRHLTCTSNLCLIFWDAWLTI